jgi:arsenate reductase
MKQLTVFAGRHLALGHLVCRRLEAGLDGRLDVTLQGHDTVVAAPEFEVLRELGVECMDITLRDSAADYLIVLDAAEAPAPTPDGGRVIDWTLLSAPFAQAASEAELRPRFMAVEGPLRARIDILLALLDLPVGPSGAEFHGSIRVYDLARSVRFYAWLLDTWPREWTHRYATFVHPDFALTFVLLVADDKTLHHDTLYHLGIGVADRAAVIEAYHRALVAGVTVGKPPRTTWRGTPLHELWLADPDGTLIEIYARLTIPELAAMPANLEPEYLVPGTAP